jgi:hypothetical protein
LIRLGQYIIKEQAGIYHIYRVKYGRAVWWQLWKRKNRQLILMENTQFINLNEAIVWIKTMT